jgi:hypothetical protein
MVSWAKAGSESAATAVASTTLASVFIGSVLNFYGGGGEKYGNGVAETSGKPGCKRLSRQAFSLSSRVSLP